MRHHGSPLVRVGARYFNLDYVEMVEPKGGTPGGVRVVMARGIIRDLVGADAEEFLKAMDAYYESKKTDDSVCAGPGIQQGVPFYPQPDDSISDRTDDDRITLGIATGKSE